MKSYNGFSPSQRYKALNWLKGEYAAGRRARPFSCDCCRQTEGIIEHHSEDYSEPFGNNIGQYALCYICHMMIHCRFRNPRQWQLYKQMVADGANFKPFYVRNFTLFAEQFLRGTLSPISFSEKRQDVLSEIG